MNFNQNHRHSVLLAAINDSLYQMPLTGLCANTWEFLHSLGKELKVMMILSLKNTLYSAITQDFSILAANNDFKVTLMESLLINRDHPPLDKNKQSLPLELLIAKEHGFII